MKNRNKSSLLVKYFHIMMGFSLNSKLADFESAVLAHGYGG